MKVAEKKPNQVEIGCKYVIRQGPRQGKKCKRRCIVDSDFCTIGYPDRTDRFVRVVLKQKIAKSSHYLEYGLWVSLSEASYEDYAANFNNENHETVYFGWLSNALPDYQFEKSIAMDVKTKSGNERPEVYPQLDFSHPFVVDFYNGITKEEAEKRIHSMLSNNAQ